MMEYPLLKNRVTHTNHPCGLICFFSRVWACWHDDGGDVRRDEACWHDDGGDVRRDEACWHDDGGDVRRDEACWHDDGDDVRRDEACWHDGDHLLLVGP
jgi:hypothetical protein